MKYYEGPWKVYDVSEAYKSFGVFEVRAYSDWEDGEKEIATVWINDYDLNEMLASLHAISKVPEMLSLLDAAKSRLQQLGDQDVVKEIEGLLTLLECNNKMDIHRDDSE
ncbi:hypothetical protein EDC32_1011280 [Laceyella sacchari]|jgi:hypothetical protein|uniref:hypothetical protein n=1 Tax=Laceyella sacchari TaxID=37482 RepID=UPI001049E969|nr:hypothetical protein [Laceyella sacchari]TCW41614.1 hypothetical protein EDC32_1011280 [Laceyella sacchari]